MSVTKTLPDAQADKGGPAQPLLIVRNLQKYFPVRGGIFGGKKAVVQAVDGVRARRAIWRGREEGRRVRKGAHAAALLGAQQRPSPACAGGKGRCSQLLEEEL